MRRDRCALRSVAHWEAHASMLAASLLRCLSSPRPRALSLFLSQSVCHPAQCWRQLLRIFLLSPPLSLSPIPGAAKCLQHVSRGQQALQGLCEFLFVLALFALPSFVLSIGPQTPIHLLACTLANPQPEPVQNNKQQKKIIDKNWTRLQAQKRLSREEN